MNVTTGERKTTEELYKDGNLWIKDKSVEGNGEVRLTKSVETLLANDGVRCTISYVVGF